MKEIPFPRGAELGKGYRFDRAEALSASPFLQAAGVALCQTVPQPVGAGSFTASMTDSRETTRSALGVDAGLAVQAHFGPVKVAADTAVSYFSGSATSSHYCALVLNSEVEFAKETLRPQDLQFKNDALEGGKEAFEATYGTHFIWGQYRGASCKAVMDYTATSSTSAEDVKQAFKAGASFLNGKAEITEEFKKEMEGIKKKAEVRLGIWYAGGRPGFDSKTFPGLSPDGLQLLYTLVTNFNNHVTNQQGEPFRALVESYSSVPGFPPKWKGQSMPWPDEVISDAFRSQSGKFWDLVDVRDQLTTMIKSPSRYRKPDNDPYNPSPPEHPSETRKWMDANWLPIRNEIDVTLEKVDAYLKKVHQGKDASPTPPTIPHLDQVENRGMRKEDLPVPRDASLAVYFGVQKGSYMFENVEKGNTQSDNFTRLLTKRVDFDKPYARPPTVVVTPSFAEVNGTHIHGCDVSDVTSTGCTLRAYSWVGEAALKFYRVDWLALPPLSV